MNIKTNKHVGNKLPVFQETLITVICELPNHFKTRLLTAVRLQGEITTATLVSQPPGEDMGYRSSTLIV